MGYNKPKTCTWVTVCNFPKVFSFFESFFSFKPEEFSERKASRTDSELFIVLLVTSLVDVNIETVPHLPLLC